MTDESGGGTRKEAEEMYHYTGFAPYLIGEHNRQIFEELQALRLAKRLRQGHKGRRSRVAAFALHLERTLSVFRRVVSAEQ